MDHKELNEIIEQLNAYKKKICVSRQTAIDALVKAGLITKDGSPTEFYKPNSEG